MRLMTIKMVSARTTTKKTKTVKVIIKVTMNVCEKLQRDSYLQTDC